LPDICVVTRDGADRTENARFGNEDVVDAIASGRSVIGISHAPEQLLPTSLTAAPDFRVVVAPLTGAVVASVVKLMTRSRGRRAVPDVLAARLDPADLVVACRPGSTASACHDRLALVASARGHIPAEPVQSFETLSGLGDAREWALSLRNEIRRYADGTMGGWKNFAESGVLAVGPPGCGKSLAARAIAAGCGIPIVQSSYGMWQSAGDGTLGPTIAEMRRSLQEAKRLAQPVSLYFCDELCSLPDRRTADPRNRPYFTAVVNAVLAEVEAASRPGVILMGAVNDDSVLDPALVRPSRFGDRILRFSPPTTENDILGIFKTHLGAELATADLSACARAALGLTGAEIANLINRGRRRARSENRALSRPDLLAEFMPPETRSASDIWRVAIHESAHACAAAFLAHENVAYLTIIPQGAVAGRALASAHRTQFPLCDDIETRVMVVMAGRAAEEVLLGQASTSAGGPRGSDLSRGSALVAAMHLSWGFGETRLYRAPSSECASLLEGDAALRRTVQADIDRIYARTCAFARANETSIRILAARLLDARVLDGREVARVLAGAPGGRARASAGANLPIVLDTPVASTALKKR
jgi:SpoVK/Ycf46/Vps4 family AAA+-type ATPase